MSQISMLVDVREITEVRVMLAEIQAKNVRVIPREGSFSLVEFDFAGNLAALAYLHPYDHNR